MLVVLNPLAGGGRALARWQGLSRDLANRLGRFQVYEANGQRQLEGRIVDALRHGERRFVAAGGDGTVNLLINALARTAPPEVLAQVTVGAVGFGSSNDFHKPVVNGRRWNGVPCRLDFDAAVPHDLGVLCYADQDRVAHRRFWINNASIGVTADGNHRFNAPDAVLRRLKRLSSNLGIGYAALRAVIGHRPRIMTLTSDDGPPLTLAVSNLGIVKNPHFTGALRYDSPHEPASGDFYVHLLQGRPRPGLLAALGGLARGRFMGCDHTRSWRAARLVVEAPEPFPVEADGEVVLAERACFTILPSRLRICA